MKVVRFPPRHDVSQREWHAREVRDVVDACAAAIARGEISGWETGSTDAGDPQLYLLGPEPERECLLCISRLGRLYVLEDGQGRIVFEHDAMQMLAEQVRGTLRRKKAAIFARAILAWMVIRETFEEKVEPVLAEPAEILAHVAPRLAALV